MTRILIILGVAIFAIANAVPNFQSKTVKLSYEGHEILDNNGKFAVNWTINQNEARIYFDIAAETLGYVGFGFSPTGGMVGADIFVAGVNSTKHSYSSDRHSNKEGQPELDAKQDYTLTDATENQTHTSLRFHRLLKTCDNDDFAISEETMKLIWAMGETDDIDYHKTVRGTKSVNFYLEDAEFEAENYEKLDFVKEMEMPSAHTTYWCSIHELPLFTEEQHVVAFEPILESEEALEHTHHFNFYRCQAPEGQNATEFFSPWISHPGDYCYDGIVTNFPFLKHCSSYVNFVWSKGGKRMVFPPDVGLPIPEVLGVREYFAMEVHYDNPQMLTNKTFSTGGRMYYTNNTRPIDAGLLVVDQSTKVQLTIPPQVSEYVVSGHCSPQCTEKILPDEGITVFNNMMHAHIAGRKMKLRHFRQGNELPWLDNDNYYDFNFQQNKPLNNLPVIKKGDQLTVECTYDTMDADGQKAVIGGLSSRDEMCQAWFFYYPKLEKFGRCGSSQNETQHMKLLGISKWEFVDADIPVGSKRVEILEPVNLRGEYQTSISYNINWTQEFKDKYQQEKRYGYQEALCGDGTGDNTDFDEIKYPERFTEYQPEDTCASNSNSNRLAFSGVFMLMIIFINLASL